MMYPDGFEDLLRQLGQNGFITKHVEVTLPAIQGLGGSELVQLLIPALQHDDVDVRTGAVFALGHFGDESAVEPLLNMLNDSQVDIFAIRALGSLGDLRVVEPLIKIYKNPRNARSDGATARHVLEKMGKANKSTPEGQAALAAIGYNEKKTYHYYELSPGKSCPYCGKQIKVIGSYGAWGCPDKSCEFWTLYQDDFYEKEADLIYSAFSD